jgi:TadE-like protein
MVRRRPNRRERRDHGQATVEFALCLPLLLMIVLLVMQLLVVGLAQVRLVNAVRDAARAAAVSADPAGAVAGALARLDLDEVDRFVDTRNGWVTVTLSQRIVTDLPLVGPLIDDVTLTESLTMLMEPPVG